MDNPTVTVEAVAQELAAWITCRRQPFPIPPIRFVSRDVMLTLNREAGFTDQQGSDALGLFGPDRPMDPHSPRVIRLSAKVDLANPIDRSILLHELVHASQYFDAGDAVSGFECFLREHDAYAAQHVWLEEQGFDPIGAEVRSRFAELLEV